MSLVFDASALIPQATGEPGVLLVDELLGDVTQPRTVHAVNLCEVFYHFLRQGNEPLARRSLRDFERVNLVTRTDIDRAFWQDAAYLKAEFPHASLANCFVITLARRVGGTIVTSDHPGFDPVAARSVCPVAFIR